MHSHIMAKSEIKRLYDRQGGLCFYCDKPMVLVGNPEWVSMRATIDHKIPKVRGGSNSSANKIAACHWCNQAKGHLTEDEFSPLIQQANGNPHLLRQLSKATQFPHFKEDGSGETPRQRLKRLRENGEPLAPRVSNPTIIAAVKIAKQRRDEHHVPKNGNKKLCMYGCCIIED